MRSRALSWFAAVAVLAAVSLSAHPARACSICGCDPSAGTLGVDRPAVSSVRLSLEDRYLTKESGLDDEAEGEKENRLLVRAQYAPLTSLVFALDVPVFLWKAHYNAQQVNDFTTQGLGDLSLSARYELFRSGGLVPRHVLAAIGTLKLPTGANDLVLTGDDGPDEHLQRGTGSVDGMFGLSYVYGDLPWVAYANVTGRVNGKNERSFQYGNALFGTLGVRRSFLDTHNLVLALEAQFRSAGKDRIGDGSTDPDSGGQVYYGALSAAYAFDEHWFVRAVAQVPVAANLNGEQSEHPVVYLGVAYDLNL